MLNKTVLFAALLSVSSLLLTAKANAIDEQIISQWRMSLSPNFTSYSCTKKRCSEMSSCDEACYQFVKCGFSRLDRDNDQIPCENICSRPCKR